MLKIGYLGIVVQLADGGLLLQHNNSCRSVFTRKQDFIDLKSSSIFYQPLFSAKEKTIKRVAMIFIHNADVLVKQIL